MTPHQHPLIAALARLAEMPGLSGEFARYKAGLLLMDGGLTAKRDDGETEPSFRLLQLIGYPEVPL